MTNAGGHLYLAQELIGQKNAESRVLFKGACEFLGWTSLNPIVDSEVDPTTLAPLPLATARGLALAREFGEDAIYAKLKAHAENSYEPTWDKATGEFTWGFGLDEPYPRGQYNAAMMTAEATSLDATWRMYNEPNLRKFIEPTVHQVDFPSVCLSQAWYDADRHHLIVSLDSGIPSEIGKPTSFRVSNVIPQKCKVIADGKPSNAWRAFEGEIEIDSTVGEHTFIIQLHN